MILAITAIVSASKLSTYLYLTEFLQNFIILRLCRHKEIYYTDRRFEPHGFSIVSAIVYVYSSRGGT
jgi:hypothetical protein